MPDAEIVPPELLVVALICRKALVDSSSPWFAIEFVFRSRAAPATLPFTIPAVWLTKDNPLLPICPRPWIVLLTFVSTAPLPDSLMTATPPSDMDSVTVPAPERLTAPEIDRNVLLAPALIRICPALEIFPATTRLWLLPIVRLSPLSIVSVPTDAAISRVTTESAALPSSMQTLVLVLFGTTPVLHIAALLQLPVPPSQFVVVPVQAVGGSGA